MTRLLILTPALFLGVAGLASASNTGGAGLLPLPTNLSARCAPLAQLPQSATIMEPRIAAQISVANCTAEEAMNKLKLEPTRESIAELEAAVTPSLQMYENVINNVDDPYWKMVAGDAKRDLYVGMVVRERNSIDGVAMKDRNALEPKIAGWLDAAASANAAVAEAARAHPDAALRDPVIAQISGRAKGESHGAVATREKDPDSCHTCTL